MTPAMEAQLAADYGLRILDEDEQRRRAQILWERQLCRCSQDVRRTR